MINEKIKAIAQGVAKHQKLVSKVDDVRIETAQAKLEARNNRAGVEEYISSNTAFQLAMRQLSRYPKTFAQIPEALIKDHIISRDAKSVYILLHSYAPNKRLTDLPKAQVPLRIIKMHLGIANDETARNYIRELKVPGWIEVTRTGCMQPNTYTLYPMSRKEWDDIVRMKSIHLRIQKDKGLQKRLMPRNGGKRF